MLKGQTPTVSLVLVFTICVLLLANLGLFLRMNQLQEEISIALEPLQSLQPVTGLDIGSRAPDFALSSMDGLTYSLENLLDERLLIVFFSTTCPVCKELQPYLADFIENIPNNLGVAIIANGEESELQELAQLFGSRSIVLDSSNQVYAEYQVPGVPWLYLLDSEGVILNRGSAQTLEDLQALMTPS